MNRLFKEVMLFSISDALFYLIVFLLPLNLGYHFITPEAYIDGLLIDYLIPTIYVQDVLVSLYVLLNLGKLFKKTLFSEKYLIWFLFVLFLSTLLTPFFEPSFHAFTRIFTYALFSLTIASTKTFRNNFSEVVKVLSVSVLLLSVLGILQWQHQGSVFDNYLFFGEQPYSAATPRINVENFLGFSKVPSYGTFRHPNIFGGFLSIVLVWILFESKNSKYLKSVFLLGSVALFFTLSLFSWISLILGVVYYYFHQKKTVFGKQFITFVVLALYLGAFMLTKFTDNTLVNSSPSYYRRADLLASSYQMIRTNPLFGSGFNTATVYIDENLPLKHDIRFAQPPHNIFVLLFAEAGVFAFIFFLFYIIGKLKNAGAHPVLYIAVLQIILLGSFDHYFVTIHQPSLLFWLLMGLI